MKITALAETRSDSGARTVHGLALHIEGDKRRILFDLGPDDTLFVNARRLGIDLGLVDTVIISHGHYDHGGALESFLKLNQRAKVYVQAKAFEPYYSRFLGISKAIGLDAKLKEHPQVVLLEGDHVIDEELSLFTVSQTDCCRSPMNDTLRTKEGRDGFAHEQNLIIRGVPSVLMMGCGHTGVVNIMAKAERYAPAVCIGGWHLYNLVTRRTAPEALLDEIAGHLGKYPDTQFYTCHCTGLPAYEYLRQKLPNIHYLACGDSLTL